MSYLILETNNKIVAAPRCLRMNFEATRAALQQKFPGRTIFSPLEPPPSGPIQIVTVYLSRSRDGRTRFTQLEQWGIA